MTDLARITNSFLAFGWNVHHLTEWYHVDLLLRGSESHQTVYASASLVQQPRLATCRRPDHQYVPERLNRGGLEASELRAPVDGGQANNSLSPDGRTPDGPAAPAKRFPGKNRRTTALPPGGTPRLGRHIVNAARELLLTGLL